MRRNRRKRNAEPASPVPIEEAMVELAQAQITAQSSAADNIDLKAMGLLGFNGALVAADLAAKDLIHHLWWVPLPGLAVSIALCLVVATGYSLAEGPDPEVFYSTYGGLPPGLALAQLLADLGAARTLNRGPLRRKSGFLTVALFTLLLTAVGSGATWLIA